MAPWSSRAAAPSAPSAGGGYTTLPRSADCGGSVANMPHLSLREMTPLPHSRDFNHFESGGTPVLKQASFKGSILPSLPDDVVLACLARVSFWDLPAARCVSRSWSAVIRTREFGRLRRSVRMAEGGAGTAEGAGEAEGVEGARGLHLWREGKGMADGNGKGVTKAARVSQGIWNHDNPCTVIVMCVGSATTEGIGSSTTEGGTLSDAQGNGEGDGRLQWFACCVCELCCQGNQNLIPRRHQNQILRCCQDQVPRWRPLPPLPASNPHGNPKCYGAVTTALSGTGFAIVGGAVPSGSGGRPEHVRHVSVFDWHMGAWFTVTPPCGLPRLDPVVMGLRDGLAVIGGCPVPFYPRGSSVTSTQGIVLDHPSETGAIAQRPLVSHPAGTAPSLPRANPSPNKRSCRLLLGVCMTCVELPKGGFGEECDCKGGCLGGTFSFDSSSSSSSSSSDNTGSNAGSVGYGCGCIQSSSSQYYHFPRLDSLAVAGRLFLRKHVSPYFGLNNPGRLNGHAHRMAGAGYQVTGAGSAGGGCSTEIPEGAVLELFENSDSGGVECGGRVSGGVESGSSVVWQVKDPTDAIHAIWTRTHVAEVTVAGCTVALPSTASNLADGNNRNRSSSSNNSSFTYSVLFSLDLTGSLLVFNHRQHKWVPAFSAAPPPRPPPPPAAAGAEAAARAAHSGSLQKLVGCAGLLFAFFQPHDDPRQPGAMQEIPLPGLDTLVFLSALQPSASSFGASTSASAYPLQPFSALPGACAVAPTCLEFGTNRGEDDAKTAVRASPVALPGNGKLQHCLRLL